ncbi:MAG: hypothetical protein R3B53_01780 [Candidatus Paceibacterota bacterium]
MFITKQSPAKAVVKRLGDVADVDSSIREIAIKLKERILERSDTPPAVRHYLSGGAEAATRYYLDNDLSSGNLPSGRQERLQFDEFRRLSAVAEEPLLSAGFSKVDINVYQTIYLLTHPNYRRQAKDLSALLVHNHENHFLILLETSCYSYGLRREGDYLGDAISVAQHYVSLSQASKSPEKAKKRKTSWLRKWFPYLFQ